MLRFSTSHNRSVYSGSNTPSNPPLASVLEQCFWSQNSDKYYFINKYNDRCASRNFNKSWEKSKILKPRPSTADARIFPTQHSLIGASGEGFSQLKFSQEPEDSSRSSTPDFMHEVYDAYSSFDNENLLLRRPVSRGDTCDESIGSCCDDVSVEKLESGVPNSRKLPETGCSSLSQIEEQMNVAPIFKKTLKVAIDIPLCDKAVPSESKVLDLRMHEEEVPTSCSEVSFFDNDDAQSVQSIKSNDSTKLKTTPRKCRTKKKKTRVKKKVEVSNVSLEYFDLDPKEKPCVLLQTPRKPSWRSSDDDVVTQMSALGLAGRPDDQLTPILRRKGPVANSKTRQDVEMKISEKKKLANTSPPSSSVAQNDDLFSKRRRVPIQIISDPFMHPIKGANSEQLKKRPHTASSTGTRYFAGVAWR